MNLSSRHSLLRAAVLGACLSASSLVSLPAQNLYWAPPSGNAWSTSAVNWSATSGGIATFAWPSGGSVTEIAHFDGAGGGISLDQDLSAGGIRFGEDGYILSASAARVLTFTGASPEVNVGSGDTATLGTNIQILSTSKQFVKTGAGLLELTSALSFFGTGSTVANGSQLTVQEGTFRVAPGGNLNNGFTVVSVNTGASLLLDANVSIGGLSGSGNVSRNVAGAGYLLIRGAGSDFSGVISGNIYLDKLNGTGVQTLSGNASNTFTGTTNVRVGTLVLAKQNGAIAISGSEVILGGGVTHQLRLDGNEQMADTTALTFRADNNASSTFNLNGHSETLGALTANDLGLGGTGLNQIDFGLNSTAQVLQFSSLSITSGGRIDILNFDETLDSLRFLADPTSQLARLFLNGETAYAFDQGSYWSVTTTIPEPGTISLLGLVGISLAALRLRRRKG
ncbi:MAG TPA: PEP-CTERM sorting domain-containing protein [Chthoniobacteraceae bacterium]|nr:PEP-CTERM sorting domain-containing protein [Chthoniobacteraceae bacterium]